MYTYVYMHTYIYMYIYIYIYSRDLGSTPSECRFFYLFRCLLSSLLPLRSVGRSDGVMVCADKKFNNVDSKATHFDKNYYIIYIYMYICVYIYI